MVSGLAAGVGMMDWLRLRPRIKPVGQRVTLTLKRLTVIVVIVVQSFGINALLNFGAFDLAAHPTQLIHIFGVGVVGLVETVMFYAIRADLKYLVVRVRTA